VTVSKIADPPDQRQPDSLWQYILEFLADRFVRVA
jgi:hypothetical protein